MKSRSIPILVVALGLSVIPCSASVFEYCIATKGPLSLHGNIDLGGSSIYVEGRIYIESDNDANALSIIGNSHIAGDVFITNPNAVVMMQGGQASIGGETGQDAIDNHVNFGVDPTPFPVPNPGYFWHYVQNTYDPNNVLSEYENVVIPAGTNPVFGAVTLKGVVFIETPNVVIFTGHTDITGIIVGSGDSNDNSGTNQIIFLGTVESYPVTDLPEEFGELRDETGIFLMAPGFSASFGGNFNTLNGAVAGNGIEFFGGAGGTIDGSVINYSDTRMELSCNSDLYFYSSGFNPSHAFLQPPIADADGPYSIYVGDTLTLDASGSTDADDDIVSYVWDLDDNGTFETYAGNQAVLLVSYSYLESLALSAGDPCNIHLKVTDSEGQTDIADSTLTILLRPPVEVAVDIKPESCPNPLNVKSKGILPAAVLGSEGFDVSTIDTTSIRLAGITPIRSSYEDVVSPVVDGNECQCTTEGADGYTDLALKFEVQEIVGILGEVADNDILVLTLTGALSDETLIEGADCIVIIGRFKPFNKADTNKDGVVDMADFAITAANWLKSSIVED